MPFQPKPSRMEAFSDGVIAVIITIMVLELKVPRQDGLAGFLTVLPSLGVYALSFTLTGIYWVNHHHLIARLKQVDPLVLWMNLTLLFALSLLPFFTSYTAEKHFSGVSVGLYTGSLLVSGIAYKLLTMSVVRALDRDGQQDAGIDAALNAAQLRLENRKGIASIALYAVSVVLARYLPRLALIPAVIVAVLWIVPGFGTSVRNPPAADSTRGPDPAGD